MKGKSKVLIITMVIFMMSTFLLQGCAIMEGETSRKMTITQNNKQLDVVLKADQEKNYEWQYFTKRDKLNEMEERLSNNILSNTYTKTYKFGMNESEEDTLILVLYQTDDVENGKVYSYEISFDTEGNISVGDCKESTLKYDEDLLDRVKAEMK